VWCIINLQTNINNLVVGACLYWFDTRYSVSNTAMCGGWVVVSLSHKLHTQPYNKGLPFPSFFNGFFNEISLNNCHLKILFWVVFLLLMKKHVWRWKASWLVKVGVPLSSPLLRRSKGSRSKLGLRGFNLYLFFNFWVIYYT
jgi:hypothetical protein